jgi:hypothetical protein
VCAARLVVKGPGTGRAALRLWTVSVKRDALAVEPLEQRISVKTDATADLGNAGELTAIDHAVHGFPGDSEKVGDFVRAQQVRELGCVAG